MVTVGVEPGKRPESEEDDHLGEDPSEDRGEDGD
jgi:hypothetical protein